jgi:hypothetical protein
MNMPEQTLLPAAVPGTPGPISIQAAANKAAAELAHQQQLNGQQVTPTTANTQVEVN